MKRKQLDTTTTTTDEKEKESLKKLKCDSLLSFTKLTPLAYFGNPTKDRGQENSFFAAFAITALRRYIMSFISGKAFKDWNNVTQAARCGHLSIVQHLIANCHKSVNEDTFLVAKGQDVVRYLCVDSDCKRPHDYLFKAAKAGNLDAITYLMQEEGKTLPQKRLITLLKRNQIDVLRHIDSYQETTFPSSMLPYAKAMRTFWNAMRTGNLGDFDWLLGKGFSLEASNLENHAPHFAKRNLEFLLYFVRRGLVEITPAFVGQVFLGGRACGSTPQEYIKLRRWLYSNGYRMPPDVKARYFPTGIPDIDDLDVHVALDEDVVEVIDLTDV